MLFEQRASRNTTKERKTTYRSTELVNLDDESNRAGEDPSQSRLDNCPFLLSDGLTNLAPEDLAFLSSKGSMSIPDRAYTKEFITQYFIRIHPILPVLDETRFWRAFEGDCTEKVSLFVFQALLFASCPVSTPKKSEACQLLIATDDNNSLFRWRRCNDAGLQIREMHGRSCTTVLGYIHLRVLLCKRRFLNAYLAPLRLNGRDETIRKSAGRNTPHSPHIGRGTAGG